MTSRLPRYEAKCAAQVLPMRVGPFAFRYQGKGATPANILIPLERQLNALQPCRFYIMKLCSRLFVLYCRSRPKDENSLHFDPHFEEVRGGVELWMIARWKARVQFLLSVIELFFTISCG